MDYITKGLWQALQLIFGFNQEVVEVAWLTIKVSGLAALISIIIGMPIGCWLATRDFRGKKVIISVVNFGMGMPPVVVGLLVSIVLWRYGPMGWTHLLYTPWAMVIAQTIIASPIIASLSFAAIVSLDPKLRMQLLSLGATSWQAIFMLVKEAKIGLLAAVIAGFGRAVSEVGASMMVGGNLKGETRILTTATVLEVSKGNYDVAIAFGCILLFIVYGVVTILTFIQHNGRQEHP